MLLGRLFLACALLASVAASVGANPIVPNPTDPNLAVWFEAGSITGVSNGGAVTSWADSSSNANNLSPIGTAPTYVAGSPGTLNGEPYVAFGGSGNTAMMSANPLPAALNNDLTTTAFIVFETTSSASNGTFGWGQAFGSQTAFGLVTNYTTPNNLSVEYAGSSPAEFGTGTLTQNSFQVMEVQKTMGAIDATTSLTVDGNPVTPLAGSSAPPAVASSLFYLGQWANYAPFPLIGGVAEVIVYDTVLDPTTAAGINEYLMDKYVNVPTPEPSTFLLGSLAAVGLMFVARRRIGR